MKHNPEQTSFFKVPDCLEKVLELQKGLHGHRYAILYLIIHYLRLQKNPVRLSAKSIRRNFHPLQVNAEHSQNSSHPCIAHFLSIVGYDNHIAEEPANSRFPDGEGKNRVYHISVPESEKHFLIPVYLMEEGFRNIFPMKPVRKQNRNLNVAVEKLYILLWLWRLSTKRNAISGNRPVLLEVKLREVAQEMGRVRGRKDVKARELLSSLEKADHLIIIRDLSGSRCVLELPRCCRTSVSDAPVTL